MDKSKEFPKYHIVSLRVSDDEREYLDMLSLATNRSVSDLMREALHKLPALETGTYPSVNRPRSNNRRGYRNRLSR